MVIISIAISDSMIVGIFYLISSLLKLLVIGKDLSLLELIFVNSSKRYYVWNLSKVLIFNFVFAHIVTIILLSIRFINEDRNWVQAKLISNGLIDANLPWH